MPDTGIRTAVRHSVLVGSQALSARSQSAEWECQESERVGP